MINITVDLYRKMDIPEDSDATTTLDLKDDLYIDELSIRPYYDDSKIYTTNIDKNCKLGTNVLIVPKFVLSELPKKPICQD